MSGQFIGAGWAFPLTTDATGSIALVTADREIAGAIWLVLATSPGERPMRPEFGSRLADYVFAPANATTAGQLANEVRVALERWEPRIDVGDVEHRLRRRSRAGVVYIDVHYQIRGDNDPRNLVFPFYIIPEERPAELTAASGERVTMPLPTPNLDDRRFQDLVDDAKRLVQQRCPEWTDHNVSDPGVTLIEAFAQMVDQLIYRLNRVPDRHYVKFLDLLGVQLFPPTAASGHRHLLAVGIAADRRGRARRDRGGHGAHGHRGAGRLRHPRGAPDRAVRAALRRHAADRRPVSPSTAPPRLENGQLPCFSAVPRPGDCAADRTVERRAVVRGGAAVRLPGSRSRH